MIFVCPSFDILDLFSKCSILIFLWSIMDNFRYLPVFAWCTSYSPSFLASCFRGPYLLHPCICCFLRHQNMSSSDTWPMDSLYVRPSGSWYVFSSLRTSCSKKLWTSTLVLFWKYALHFFCNLFFLTAHTCEYHKHFWFHIFLSEGNQNNTNHGPPHKFCFYSQI